MPLGLPAILGGGITKGIADGHQASDKRGQIAIKGHEVTDEWEARVRKAAQRTGLTMAGFIVDHTNSAARGDPQESAGIPAASPVRIEDVAAGLQETLAKLAAAQAASTAELRKEMARQGRRGRWRR